MRAVSRAPARPLQALVLYDVLRLRAWIRGVATDRTGALIVFVVCAAGVGAGLFAAVRVGRSVAHAPTLAFVAGAAVAALAVAAQGRLGRSLEGGPLEAAGLAPGPTRAWSGARTLPIGLPLLLALALGAWRGGAGAFAELALPVGFVLALAATLLVRVRAPVLADETSARPHDSRVRERLGLWSVALFPALERRAHVPRWLLLLGLAAGGAVLVRLGARNGGEAVAAALTLASAVACGLSVRELEPHLLSALALTRQPLPRLLALFTVGPLLAALAGGLVAAIASGAPLAAGLAAAGAGAALCALWTAVDALNLVAHGPTGPTRTVVYAALTAGVVQAIGPAALLGAAGGLFVLYRIAAARRWRGL